MATKSKVAPQDVELGHIDDGPQVDENPNQWKLFVAAKSGDLEFFVNNDSVEVELDTVDKDGYTCLHYACLLQRWSVVIHLIERGADVTVVAANDTQVQPIHCAAGTTWKLSGKLIPTSTTITDDDGEARKKAIRLLLEKGASVDIVMEAGKTAVHIAAETGCVPFMEVVQEAIPLDRLRDVISKSDAQNGTALHKAASEGHSAVVAMLIQMVHSEETGVEEKKYLNSVDVDGRTALHLASFFGRDEAVKHLVSCSGVGKNLPDTFGRTALHYAVATKDNKPHVEIVRQLIQAQSDLSVSDQRGQTPTHRAATYDNPEVMQILIEAGADVNATDNNGSTPLHIAAYWDCPRVLKTLRYAKAIKRNERNNDHRTPLHVAINRGSARVAETLLRLDRIKEKDQFKRIVDELNDGTYRSVDGRPVSAIACMIENNLSNLAESLLDKSMWIGVLDQAPAEQPNSRSPNAKRVQKYLCFDYGLLQYGRYFIEEERDNKNALSGHNTNLKSSHTVWRIISTRTDRLLTHPVILSYIKWRWSITWPFLLFYYILSACYTCLLTVNINFSRSPLAVCQTYKNQWNLSFCEQLWSSCSDACSTVTTMENLLPSSSASTKAFVIARHTQIVVLVLSCILIVPEIFQLWTNVSNQINLHRMSYPNAKMSSTLCGLRFRHFVKGILYHFYSLENVVQISTFVMAIAYTVDWNSCLQSSNLKCSIQWQLGAFSVFTAWINLLLILRQNGSGPLSGIFVEMFLVVFRKFLSYVLPFIMFILAFSVPFFMMLTNQNPFATFQDAFLKTITMSFGEMDFGDIFYTEEDEKKNILFRSASGVIYISFLFLVVLIIQNLFTGIAFEDVKQIREEAAHRGRKMKVNLCLALEVSMPRFITHALARAYDLYLISTEPVQVKMKSFFITMQEIPAAWRKRPPFTSLKVVNKEFENMKALKQQLWVDVFGEMKSPIAEEKMQSTVHGVDLSKRLEQVEKELQEVRSELKNSTRGTDEHSFKPLTTAQISN